MTAETMQALSRVLTDDIADVPSVRAVLPPGPALAVLVQNVRSALDVPRSGGAVLVRETPDGPEVRVVVEVVGDEPIADVLRRIRDVVRGRLRVELGSDAASITVRAVDIR